MKDWRIKRNLIFATILEIQRESLDDERSIFQYTRETYGIDIEDYNGYITPKFAIINEQKYLLFRIKFGL